MIYLERRKSVEAHLVDTDNADDVASWCDGQVRPDGSILYPVGDMFFSCPVGHYLVRDGNRVFHETPEAFTAAWEPADTQHG